MRKIVGFVLMGSLAVVIGCGLSCFTPSQAQARDVVNVEGAKFDTSFSMADNLKTYSGKNIFVHLKSGTTLQGYVKTVGNNFVHLEKLAGKDFYDALIRIEEISAIEARFRTLK